MSCLPSATTGFASGPILRSLSEFDEQELVAEMMNAVLGARVICANYELILHDFKDHLQSEVTRSPIQHLDDELKLAIDDWLVAQTAYISEPQSAQEVVNTTVAVSRRQRTVYRPPRYDRAAVMCAEANRLEAKPALFDVKGCGVKPGEFPVLPNSNGLLMLSEALHEFIMERFAYAALKHAGSLALPVPAYAILDLGFDAKFYDGKPNQRAALLIRRAQTRPKFQWGKTNPGKTVARQLLEIEMTLRRYGITASSCGAIRFRVSKEGETLQVKRDHAILGLAKADLERIERMINFQSDDVLIDGVNVQVANGLLASPAQPRILDFGRYLLRHSFDSILYSAWEANYENLQGEMLLPGNPRYIQPDRELSLAGAFDHPLYSRLMDSVQNYVKGIGDRSYVGQSLNDFVFQVISHLR